MTSRINSCRLDWRTGVTLPRQPIGATTGHQPVTPQLMSDLNLKDQLKSYAWNHPGLNTCLLNRAVQRYQLGQQPLITKDIAKECLLAVTAAVSCE